MTLKVMIKLCVRQAILSEIHFTIHRVKQFNLIILITITIKHQ